MCPVLIVGTGRCGSTMMSELVRLHPRMLSVSEFFTSLGSKALVPASLGGEELCGRLATTGPAVALTLRDGMRSAEVLYGFGPDARYRPDDLPPLLGATLPFLSPRPERLHGELVAAVRGRGRHSLAEHYRFILDWLAGRLGKRMWVERSGASIRLVPVLARWFPDARFVHVCRDGRDVAVSMRVHPASRLLLGYAKGLADVGLDPFPVENAWGADPLAPMIERRMADGFVLEEYQREEVDVAEMGWLWNGMVETGLDGLERLAPGRVTTIRFEDLVSSPKDVLGRLIRWIDRDLEDAEWIEAVARVPRPAPPRWPRLPEEDRERLARACASGLRRLGYATDGAD